MGFRGEAASDHHPRTAHDTHKNARQSSVAGEPSRGLHARHGVSWIATGEVNRETWVPPGDRFDCSCGRILPYRPLMPSPFEDGIAAYERGDYLTALHLWKPLAEQGNASAQFNLGLMHADGRGVPQNDAEAVKWYQKAADQGDAMAKINLGVLYANDQGEPQDYVQAHLWFSIAAARYPEKDHREEAVSARDRVAAKITPEQIAEAQALATNWKPKVK